MRANFSFLSVGWWALLALLAGGQPLWGGPVAVIPVMENNQSQVPYNQQSMAGIPPAANPLITTNNDWSNGQQALATTNQFQGFVSFGAICAPPAGYWAANSNNVQVTQYLQGTTPFSGLVAQAMGLPVGLNGTNASVTGLNGASVSVILQQAWVGTPYVGQQAVYYLGSVITPPDTNVWQARPWPFGATNENYYWSPNAQQLFATQPGTIWVTWITTAPCVPTNGYVNANGGWDPNPATNYFNNSGSTYKLYTMSYVVASAPVKPAQNMYWTEGSFANLGYKVQLPQGRVFDIHVAYNSQFPQNVATPYQDPDSSTTVATTQTLWDDNSGYLHAYNKEGLVFVELLGAPISGTQSQYLGFEIVQVSKAAIAATLTANLGDMLAPYQDGWEGTSLVPSPLQSSSGAASSSYYYSLNNGNGPTLYADVLTTGPTDLQVYWLDTGVAGLQWPDHLVSYNQVWPSDPALYSPYLRPLVATPEAAALTAVALDATESPSIDYQDPLDQTRGFLTPTKNGYYSWLSTNYPAHRALLRFNMNGQVRFERVFSYLAQGFQNNSLFSQSVVTNLIAWTTNNTLDSSNYPSVPSVVHASVNVGDRINAPPGAYTNGVTGDYWAGYINTNQNSFFVNTNIGNSYDVDAYFDPFVNGFSMANLGSIIPVNAVPGQNVLEVWWFQPNAAPTEDGFQTVYWPTVIGDYTINWPSNSTNKIVLASNQGSGPLSPWQAAGQIYYQNDPTQPGYNPNEEHAVLMGGAAYALRDDLNLTNATPGNVQLDTNYSSAPYVLLEYADADGRPSMSLYKVQREDPDAGIYFDYIVTAGKPLQGPMPLPLLPPAIMPNTNYQTGVSNYTYEVPDPNGDLPYQWTSADASGAYGLYQYFTFQDRKSQMWVYRGLHAGLPPLQAGTYNVTNNDFEALPPATAVVGSNFTYCIQVSRLTDTLVLTTNVGSVPLPAGLVCAIDPTNGLKITGTPSPNANLGTFLVTLLVGDSSDGSVVTNLLSLTVANSGPVIAQGPLALSCTNVYSQETMNFTNRPPSLALAPAGTNSFRMRYYYRTQPGFAWPNWAQYTTNLPAVGSVVPYLRPLSNGTPIGDPTSSNTPSLDIVYRPVWPEPLPTLQMGQTLTTPVAGLTAIRGQDSVQVLYQEAIATNQNFESVSQGTLSATNVQSVVLYDPTVQKQVSLAPSNGLPVSVQANLQIGIYYFPGLPPNLISRIWYDPISQNLYFQGQFVSDPVNGSYVLLNVLRGDDLAAVDGLCDSSDVAYSWWTNKVANLAAREYTFWMDPALPGHYDINPSLTVTNLASDLVEVTNVGTAVDSYALSATGPGEGYLTCVVANDLNPIHASDPISLIITRVKQPLFPGAIVTVNSANASPFSQTITFEHTADLAGRTANYVYDWRLTPPVDGNPPVLGTEANWTQEFQDQPGPVFTLGASGVLGLSDNYVSMRYGELMWSNNGTGNILVGTNWSAWANPILAPGWLKRVTQNLDPIAGETQNLYDNPAITTANLIQLAGARWDGDVPLNASSLTNYGLISLYETVLDYGENLSINDGINYGPVNQALLLTAGYLNDLYMTLGNAAWANSLNPTISFGTDNTTYGAVATASFCFEGEVPTLLAQNEALLRGRDDSESPGVDMPPVYNRLWWNYTYGLTAGETIYALNYNITDQNGDGVVTAADAQIMFPQGHGDAYGHYLTALTEYYKLLMNPFFQWVPESEAVVVLGATVEVNYEDERKFAATAGALARTGRQIFDLEWRQDYQPGTAGGWGYFSNTYVGQYTFTNNSRQLQPITRYWGMDHWASRVAQGAYLHWVVGNALLPPVDTNPNDQGVEKVDRTTVPELAELPQTAQALQTDLDNANAGFTPLGLAQNAIPFDINPQQVTGADPQTHFDQIYARAVQALNNAVTAFNAAQNVCEELREEQNSLSDLQASVAAQNQAYNDELIEFYGTPYLDDMGPGQTYSQDYTGPDLVHYMYVDNVNTNTYNGILPDNTSSLTFYVDVQTNDPDSLVPATSNGTNNPAYDTNTTLCVAYTLGPDGFTKPAGWTSERASVGSIENAEMAVNSAQDKLRQALFNAQNDKLAFDSAVAQFNAQTVINQSVLGLEQQNTTSQKADNASQLARTILQDANSAIQTFCSDSITYDSGAPTFYTWLGADAIGPTFAQITGTPTSTTLATGSLIGGLISGATWVVADTALQADSTSLQDSILDNSQTIANDQYTLSQQNALHSLSQQLSALQNDVTTISQDQVALNGAQGNYATLVAQGNRLQQEQLTFRQHTAAQVQGYTVADAAFLVFQNEDLERYTTLFNLAAEYAYMAANAYDYETGLLGTPAGQAFVNQIISSCALGVIQNGEPQMSGTATGDPGLANALAEMNTDWLVVKDRLGFNNPDGYGTTVSLRSENYRILPGAAGDSQWRELLQNNLMADVRADSDVEEHCMQIDTGQPVPGIVLSFGTTITDGENLFGQALGPGDHAYSSSSFATKIFAVGVCFDGYVGMDNPVANSSAGGTSPSDPTLDANALAATPYVYLIPCGADLMRTPPLGDTSAIRTWNVDDVAIPLPLNIGESDFSSAPFYTSSDSLSEPLFAVRKQEAFRPVSTTAAFDTSIYGATGSLQPSQYTNQRLIGRSIWNTEWKLVIPGNTLLADPNQGLARFINSVNDIHLYFVTYSYAGN